MKHLSQGEGPATAGATIPPAARTVFGAALPLAERYRHWLATAGVERGLVGPREADRLWERHLLNSAVLAPWLPAQGTVLDLGSGAGLPGIVLALLRPDLDVVLLEPMLRRVTFLNEVIADLGLPRTTVVRGRAEDLAGQRSRAANVVVARAVAPLHRLIDWAAPLIAPGGFLLALKGETVAQELTEANAVCLAAGMAPAQIHPVVVGSTVTHVVKVAGPATKATKTDNSDKSGHASAHRTAKQPHEGGAGER